MRAACKAEPGEKLADAIALKQFHAEAKGHWLVFGPTMRHQSVCPVTTFISSMMRAYGGHVFDLNGENFQWSACGD